MHTPTRRFAKVATRTARVDAANIVKTGSGVVIWTDDSAMGVLFPHISEILFVWVNSMSHIPSITL